jgi:hypothetical protein
MRYLRLAFAVLALAIGGGRARGEQDPSAPDPHAPSLPDSDSDSDSDADDGPALHAQIEALRNEVRELREERRNERSALTINGYVDLGFFAPFGNNGVGWIQDFGNRLVPNPDYQRYTWTFLGDILGSPVNTRGEAADLGQAPDVNRFDSVHSGGKPGFIANEVNMRLEYALAERAIMRASVDFVPRSPRQDFDLGDFIDVDLAEIEYLLTADGKTSIWAGKVLPVFGIEYKERKSDQRFGVTPSLIARYTTESQLGLKLRSKLLHDWLIVAASATNNSSSSEQFHFHSEIDRNSGKMLNGRLALSIPIGDLVGRLVGDRLELGASGEWGPQDWATTNDGDLWLGGVDLQYLSANFALKAQVMRGKAPGRPEDRAWTLDLRPSGYVELDWQLLSYLGILLRAEQRDATVTLGLERLYLTKVHRFTGGLRVVFNPHVALKLEYLYNREYGDIPQIRNDVFTSSLVLMY